jgi:hypothetical protein
MADRGGFVNVPGKGRRFRTPEGEYRYGAPGDVTAGIIPRIEKFFRTTFTPRGTDRFTPAEMNALLRGKNYALGGERQGPYVPDRILNAPLAPILPEPSGLTGGGGGQPQFKAQPMTSQGQFDRYFGTSEMDPFFGSSSRGAGAPKTAEEMMALATQQKAPMETPLSTYYRSQSAAGRAEMPAITEGLGYAKGTQLAQWAEANPMLAKRLFEKTKAKKAAGTEEDAYAHPRDLGAGAQAEQGYTLAAYGIK